jgi:tetratricopeptide (TPR) repeat protein
MRKSRLTSLALPLVLVLGPICSASGQTPPTESKADLRERALEFAAANRYLDAYPLLDKIASQYPQDADVWESYGIAILVRSGTLTSPAERKTERVRGREALVKARELGTRNIIALDLLDKIPPDGGVEDNFSGAPDFEKSMREGEAFFGRGEYSKAYTAYEKAHKLDPKSYEAVLFMGDSLYSDAKYPESIVWFEQAVVLDPDREMAHRFWADALMKQKKFAPARDKYVDAFIAEPFARSTWERLTNWLDESGTRADPIQVNPPGHEVNGPITIDRGLLKAEDGTVHWGRYDDYRAAQKAASGTDRRTLVGESAALKKVAAAARAEIAAGKIKYPHASLINLIKLDDAGLVECYVLYLRSDENVFAEYESFRKNHRADLKRYVIQFLLGTT